MTLHCSKVVWLLKLLFTGTELPCNDWKTTLINSYIIHKTSVIRQKTKSVGRKREFLKLPGAVIQNNWEHNVLSR